MQLERSHVHTWKDLDKAFLKHYQYKTDMALNHTKLQNLTHKCNKSFKEYARIRIEMVARVQPPMMDRELVYLLMGTLKGPYLLRMIGNVS